MAPRATYLILAASALDLSHALLGRGRHKSEHREHETRSRKTPDPDVVISEGAKKLEYQVRLGASDMKWPEGSFMSCLASRSRDENKTYQMQQCLALNQARCGPKQVQPVCAWAAGFGSGIHLWVHSFTYALEHGLVWLPTGPWSYTDAQRCPSVNGSEVGQSCYFKDVTTCPAGDNETLSRVCAQWYNKHNGTTLVINAAKQLNKTREWVWGQLASFMMQMKPDVKSMVDARIPQKLKEGPSAAIQIRVVSAATGQDGMRVNLGVRAYLDHIREKVANLTVKPNMLYVMSDDPSLSEASLNAQYGRYSEYSRNTSTQYQFLRPTREWADVARGSVDETQSKSQVTYDLLADIFAAYESEVFIGTASNLFWLIYALKQTKKDGPGINCWINTVEASDQFKKLFCPGDPGFYYYSPPGLRYSSDEEYVALLREGLDRKTAWFKALDIHHLRTKKGAVL
mmetsp:Transcript_45921/g.123834  ORF Transcript_45921/g.123834 Transcript_45921/m.123834 type:complete len:457 (+) Transcript_45921:94-1464(+)